MVNFSNAALALHSTLSVDADRPPTPLSLNLWEPSSRMFSRRPRTKEEFDEFLATRKASIQYEAYHPRDTRENSRLNMIFPARVSAAALASFGIGTVLGMTQGSKMAGMRFRAEHAHKLPITSTGWFMYHKSKNYNMAREGLKEGMRMGSRVCFWTTAMFFIENLYDDYRQSKDFVNTVLASLTVAGAFSLWSESTLCMLRYSF